MKKSLLITFSLFTAIIFASCASNSKVTRVSSDTVKDLSGYWNDTDVKIAASEIINGCLSSAQINAYPGKHAGKLPVVIVGTYANKSDEHIDTSILVKKLQASLINSGKVKFVASSSQRDELRAERKDQQINASEATAKNLGNETGADFMMQGSVKTIVDSDSKTATRTYFITTELINIETNDIIWMDDNSSIKKVIKKSTVRF